MAGRLLGKKALVTGAGQGLGAAIAAMMAREGALVLLTDRDEPAVRDRAAAINDELGEVRAFSAALNVTLRSEWNTALEVAGERMSGLSVLVNNAGIAPLGSIESLDEATWDQAMRINLDSVFHGCRAALPLMRESQPGSIVNISSIAGLIASPGFAAYNTSKAAVWMLTKSIALHCAREGWDIRCNSIHPTFVRTALLDSLGGDRSREEMEARFARQIPTGRLGDPDDVAYAAVYLASDESRMMTASELKLDGGISAM
jgi:NAD(P)-dependent dehydrogenase (short-subunit alcohol dehydrogenase family)